MVASGTFTGRGRRHGGGSAVIREQTDQADPPLFPEQTVRHALRAVRAIVEANLACDSVGPQ